MNRPHLLSPGRPTAIAALLFGIALALPAALALTGPAAAQSADAQAPSAQTRGAEGPSAAALIYHRFGETDHPSTNIRMEQFEAHLEELVSGRYNVVTLGTVAAALKNGTPLPPRTVAISVDDAYSSVYARAFPLLQEKGLPFTLFVATDPVDRSLAGYMSWDQLRELAAAGVEIGSQAVTHPHMPAQSALRNRRELTRSADRLEEELGVRPALFAYPYGEASAEIMRLTREAGYDAAFGQHSGAIGPTLNRFYLPRFPVNEAFGGVDRFRRVAKALPLPVTDLTPDDPFLGSAGESGGTDNPPAFGFTLAETGPWVNALACYHSGVGRVQDMERLGPRIELRFARPFPPGRTRINCTAPTAEGRWRWFGMQYYVAP